MDYVLLAAAVRGADRTACRAARGSTENVVELMASKIQKLDPSARAALEIGATLAVVIGPAGRIAGYTLAADLSVASDAPDRHYRPGVRLRARDGFCPLAPRVLPASAVPAPDALLLSVSVDGGPAHRPGRRRSRDATRSVVRAGRCNR